MCPDNGAVDHLDALSNAFRLVEGFQEKLPQPKDRPASKLPVDRRPFAEILMQVPPLGACAGEPENAIQNKAMILRAASNMRPAHCDERFEAGPFLIRHQSTNQAHLLAKATLSQNRA